jgi:cyclase
MMIMITKRIIPCLDVKDGMVVKGVNFRMLKDIASPVDLACYYNDSGADELVFYDVAASVNGRQIFTDILKETASKVFIPLTVGGAINSVDDFDRVLKCGADKVSVNTGAIKNPNLIYEAAKIFGSQCVVLSVDIKLMDGKYYIFTAAGHVNTGIDAFEHLKRGIDLGAGELVINSIDADGVKNGFDLPLLKKVCDMSPVPVIASGGAGNVQHFIDLFKTIPEIDAALAASVFHFGEIAIGDLKQTLRENGIDVRI